MTSPLTTHPNASRVAGGGSIAVLVVWLAGYFGVSLTAEAGAALATVASGVWVFIGREGLLGAWRRLLHGSAPAFVEATPAVAPGSAKSPVKSAPKKRR